MEKDIDKIHIAQSMEELWGLLSDEQRTLFVENIEIRRIEKDEAVYHKGDVPSFMFFLLNGKIKICKEGIGGREQIVRLIKPYTFFGYRSAFADEQHKTTGEAYEPSTIAYLPIDFMKQLIAENGQVGILFIRQLAYALGIADMTTVNMTQKHLRGRLAEALIRLIDNYGYERDGHTLNISTSREDLAKLSNMTTSNAIRTLSSFAGEGLIAIEGKHIAILKEDELAHISYPG